MTHIRHRVDVAGMALALALLGLGLVDRGLSEPQNPTDPALPDVQKLGPQIGERVPMFTLVDQHNQPRTLASLMGQNGLMLVFFRSADW